MGNPTIQELNTLLDKQDEKRREEEAEKLRVDKALTLNLCPTCGSKLEHHRPYKEQLTTPKRQLFGLLPNKTHTTWDNGTFCSKNKQHYMNKYDYLYSH